MGYYYLVPSEKSKGKSLYEGESENFTKDTFLSAQNNGKGLKYFIHPSIKAFAKSYIDRTIEYKLQKSYDYEIIQPTSGCKMYFDLDLQGKGHRKKADEIKSYIIEKVKSIFINKFNVKLKSKHFKVYQSHNQDKSSYHIVINGYYFPTISHVKELTMKTFQDSPYSKKEIDMSVYNVHRQFRCLYSHKVSDNPRWKLPDSEDEEDITVEQLLESLITYTKDSMLLSFDLSMAEKPKSDKSYSRVVKVVNDEKRIDDINIQNIENAVKLYGSFSVDKIEEHFISLRRNAPSWCIMCHKIHNNNNAYVKCVKNKFYFNCHQSVHSSYLCDVVIETSGSIFNVFDNYSHDDFYRQHLAGAGVFESQQEALEHWYTIKPDALRVYRFNVDTSQILVKAATLGAGAMYKEKLLPTRSSISYKTKIGTHDLSIEKLIQADCDFSFWKTINTPTCEYKNPNYEDEKIINIFPGYGEYVEDFDTESDTEYHKLLQDPDIVRFRNYMKDIIYPSDPCEEEKCDGCDTCEQNFRYGLDLLASSVQWAKPAGVIDIAFSSLGDTGKSLFNHFIGTWVWGFKYSEFLFRSSCVNFQDNSELNTRFLDGLAEGTKVIIDEFNSTNKKTELSNTALSLLKGLLTAEQLRVQVKAKKSITFQNYLHIRGSTNNLKCVEEINDPSIAKRVFVHRVNDKYHVKKSGSQKEIDRSAVQHDEYFKPLVELYKSPVFGRKLFTMFALHKITDRFNPQRYPMDSFQKELRVQNADGVTRFFRELILGEVELGKECIHQFGKSRSGDKLIRIESNSLQELLHTYLKFKNNEHSTTLKNVENRNFSFIEKKEGNKRFKIDNKKYMGYEINITTAMKHFAVKEDEIVNVNFDKVFELEIK